MLVLERLVVAGHTLVLIEHNLDVIKLADWIIDMGPEGGIGGGKLVAMGRPEEIVKVPESHTGQWLVPLLGDGVASASADGDLLGELSVDAPARGARATSRGAAERSGSRTRRAG